VAFKSVTGKMQPYGKSAIWILICFVSVAQDSLLELRVITCAEGKVQNKSITGTMKQQNSAGQEINEAIVVFI